MRNSVLAFCLATLVLGCGREDSVASSASVVVAVTNVVEVTREIVVTNVVTNVMTVTNADVVVETREPKRILSARKTAPYVVSAKSLTATQLRKFLVSSGARVIDCDPGAVALVEATDGMVGELRSAADVSLLSPEDKVAADAGEHVRVVPLSSIDAAAVAKAVRDLGGEIEQVVTVGAPVIRAKMSYSSIRKLAERGDVRRIERDAK